MEGSNEFNNQKMKIGKHIICINDETKVNEVMEERKNPSLQTKVEC
jgi:hypothetical protein